MVTIEAIHSDDFILARDRPVLQISELTRQRWRDRLPYTKMRSHSLNKKRSRAPHEQAIALTQKSSAILVQVLNALIL
ncbi:hypothetical protein [Merismopedia glauca]|uniref:hypothetical protein n=1 Tax=Merismopedia glauca TaxID=292586 RepID=UPI0011B1F1CD|nr:hypothetical protein [Merismopedia glauca]